jgi:hypothetical protein
MRRILAFNLELNPSDCQGPQAGNLRPIDRFVMFLGPAGRELPVNQPSYQKLAASAE